MAPLTLPPTNYLFSNLGTLCLGVFAQTGTGPGKAQAARQLPQDRRT